MWDTVAFCDDGSSNSRECSSLAKAIVRGIGRIREIPRVTIEVALENDSVSEITFSCV